MQYACEQLEEVAYGVRRLALMRGRCSSGCIVDAYLFQAPYI